MVAPMPAMATVLMVDPSLTHRQPGLKGLFTWLVPLVSLWDGLASAQRVYSRATLLSLAARCGSTCDRHAREIPYGGVGLAVVFWGVPRPIAGGGPPDDR